MFYNVASGKQARLALNENFKHCDVVTYDGDIYLHLSWNHQGIQTRRVKARSTRVLLRAFRCDPRITAIIAVYCEKRAATGWRPLRVQSCNEFCRFVSGMDIGFTWDPYSLYKKMLRYDHKRNYEVISAWRRENNGLGRRQ